MDWMKKIKNMEENQYLWAFGKWGLLAILTGLICGLVGSAFSYGVAFVTSYRTENLWTLFLLPVSGLIIVFLYQRLKITEDKGTNLVLSSALDSTEKVPLRISFLMFVSTILTHLCGGSAGREGAALQIGAGLSTAIGKLFPLDKKDRSIMVMCGMSGLFSALFGTPLTATIFSVEVVSIGIIQGSALFPCLLSALTAFGIAQLLKVPAESYTILDAPAFTYITVFQVLIIGIICAFVSILFCMVMHKTGHFFKEKIKNPYIRILVGSAIIIVFTLVIGYRDYNGAGGQIIEHAMEGHAVSYAFLLKIIFTAITLGCGFKGGEIVPSFFIGSTLGCTFAPLIGLSPSFGAALGLIGVFCGCVNCPIASIILGIELFGGEQLLPFAIVCIVSFLLSGRYSLYSTQKIAYAKNKLQFVDDATK